jgi:hypothetical protein
MEAGRPGGAGDMFAGVLVAGGKFSAGVKSLRANSINQVLSP